MIITEGERERERFLNSEKVVRATVRISANDKRKIEMTRFFIEKDCSYKILKEEKISYSTKYGTIYSYHFLIEEEERNIYCLGSELNSLEIENTIIIDKVDYKFIW
jgi:hypothetical protein